MRTSRSRGRRPSQQQKLLRGLLGLLALVVLVVGGYAIGRRIEERQYQQERGVMSENFGQLPTLEYNGQVYLKRPEVTTLLLMGVDTLEGTRRGFRSGGQADFLLLLALDHTTHTIHQLQIDRDSIVDVTVVGVLGNVTGTRAMQICLSHAYGGTEKEGCDFTVEAVQRLLPGVDVQLYMSVRLDAIGVFNSALGGVTVTVPMDMTAADPAFVEGAVLTLTDEQAESFVRARRTVGDGLNSSRMLRQRLYMSAAVDRMRALLSQDAGFAATLFDALDEVSGYNNMERGQMINEINRAYNYDILPVESLTGEYKIGSDGFMECHVDADSAMAWVLNTLYEPKK